MLFSDTSKGPDVSQPSFLTALRNKDGVEMLSEADRASLHHHLLLEFALTLLHSAVKRGPLSNRSPETLAFLDPVLPLLARSLGSRHQGCVNAALRCLCHLVTLGPSSTPQVGKDKDNRAFLPSLTSTCNAAGKAITRLLKKAPNAAHPVALECFRLLGAMLRGCESYKPSTGQVRFLLGWLFADRHADDSPGRQNAFALLRAVLSRKIVVPEVYDVMEWVQEVMVRSQSNNVRSMCSSTLLQFLLDYPLGPKRLAQHLSFLTANLAYEHESGRMAVLDTLGAVIHKFPSSVIQAHRELLMLPLLTRLVNDVSAKARALAGGVLRSLLQGLEQEHRDQFAEFCATWLAAGDQAGGSRSSDKASMLRRTAAQALCALADVEGTKFGKRMVALGPLVVSVLSSQSSSFDATAIDAAKEEEEADDNADPDSSTNSTSRCPGWQEAYYGLLLIEKVLSKCPSSLTYPDESPTACRELWELVPKLLLHRHLWMRKAASRVMCLGLALPPIAMAGFWAARETRAAELSFAFFMQLEAEGADDGVCVQAIKCLVQVAIRLKAQEDTKRQERDQGTHPIDEGKDKAGDEEEEEEQEEEEEEVEEKKEEDAEEDEQEEEEEKVEAKLQAFTLQGLMRRMAKLAGDNRVMFQTQRMAALRWIAAVATALTGPAITPYLSTLLVPLYRLSELVGSGLTPSLKPHEEEAKALGDEVMSHLRQVVGADAMLQAFAVARDKVRGSRMERKKKQAMQNLVDPEAAARARVKRGVKKTVGRKRKMEEMKRLRSARVFQSSGPRGRGRGRGGGGGGAKRGLTGEGPDAAGGREVSGKRQRLGAAFSSGRGSIGGGGGRGGAGRGSSRGGRGGGSGRGGGKGRGTSFKSLSKFGLS